MAQRVHVVPVTVTRTPATPTAGPTTTLGSTVVYPGTNGCAFLERPPGNYQVKVGPAAIKTPFVQPGTVAYKTAVGYATGTLPVAVNKVSLASFVYDEGAYVNVTYPDTTATSGGVTCSRAAQVCLATGEAPTGTAPDGLTGTAATVSVLSSSTWRSRLTSLGPDGIHGIESVSCTSTICLAVGYGGTTRGAAVTYNPTASANKWAASTLPAGVTNLQQVTCPGATTCLAIGSGATGPVVLVGTVSGQAVSWAVNALPGVNGLREITCPSPTVCMVLGATGGSAVVLSGATTGSWTWTPDALPHSISSLFQLTCPTSTSCEAIGSGVAPAAVVTGTFSSTWSWATAGLPTTVTSLTDITCPSGTACIAVGSGTGSAAVATGSPAGPWTATTVGGATSLRAVTCTGATTCLATGSASGTATIVGGGVSHPWSMDTVSGATSIGRIDCPGTGVCVAAGGGPGGAVILTGAASPTAETWTAGSVHGGAVPAFVAGIGCFTSSASGGGLVCAAAGGSPGGASLLASTTASAASSTWTTRAPATGAGVVAGGLATFVSSTALPSGGFVACGPSATDACAGVGPLFPYTVGYAIGAGTCATDLNTASVHVKSVPGATVHRATTVTLPLGLAAVKVVNGLGQPVPGATVSATVSGVAPPHTSCNGGSYSLGTTGGAGTVTAAVMYQAYVVTVTAHGHVMTKSVVISPTGVSVTSSPLPAPTPVVFVT